MQNHGMLPVLLRTAASRLVVLALVTLVQLAQAEVTGIDIAERGALASGHSFGERGGYEAIKGKVHFAVDPLDRHNAVIADIALAPRNAKGKVEFTADILIWKPVDMARGNNVSLVDIANRGKPVMTAFNKPTADNPLGDGFLMNAGYTLVWVGWEYDSPLKDGINIQVPSVAGVDNSKLSGLGMAAVRDIGSWIAHDPAALVHTEHLMSFGLSQSGRFLRTFLYYGFNEDVQGQQVYQGMLVHIAGASRLDLNRRGAEPVGLAMYNATAYPFTDAVYPDPLSAAKEGLLDNPRTRATQPRIFYTNSGSEYWGGGRVAALAHTLPDGSADIELQKNVRLYYLASTQHGPDTFPPGAATSGQLPANPLDYWWHMRALLTALTQWVVAGTEPPASRYPTLAAHTLVSVNAVKFPELAGVHTLKQLNAGTRIANPELPDQGASGKPLPMLVPQVDADGNDLGGIRHPELSVPLATYTGWNFQKAANGNADQLVPLTGSYIPFAASKAARTGVNDPRLSIAERYAGKAEFIGKVKAAANALVAGRYLLQPDVAPILERAGAHWDQLTK